MDKKHACFSNSEVAGAPILKEEAKTYQFSVVVRGQLGRHVHSYALYFGRGSRVHGTIGTFFYAYVS
jgi:hypothetical protein